MLVPSSLSMTCSCVEDQQRHLHRSDNFHVSYSAYTVFISVLLHFRSKFPNTLPTASNVCLRPTIFWPVLNIHSSSILRQTLTGKKQRLLTPKKDTTGLGLYLNITNSVAPEPEGSSPHSQEPAPFQILSQMNKQPASQS
jgi:hypothetical protein